MNGLFSMISISDPFVLSSSKDSEGFFSSLLGLNHSLRSFAHGLINNDVSAVEISNEIVMPLKTNS